MIEEGRIRSVKAKVEENSAVLDRLVDALVVKYNSELHEFITRCRRLLKTEDEVSNQDIEAMVLKIPIYMYFAISGLESLGIEGDNAKAIKMEAFNQAYLDAQGTIQDKTKEAELQTFSEHLVDIAFNRAYKKLKSQLEVAEAVFSGAKKVLSKRMLEYEINKGDVGSYGRAKRYDQD